jgi:hypothetical protein
MLEAATALVYREVSTLLDRVEDLQSALAFVNAGLAEQTASLKAETDRREELLDKSILAMRTTTDSEKQGLVTFIERQANELVALATQGQAAAMKTAAREVFKRDVEASFDKLVAAVAHSRAGSAPSPLMRLVELTVVALLGGCAGALTVLNVTRVWGLA